MELLLIFFFTDLPNFFTDFFITDLKLFLMRNWINP